MRIVRRRFDRLATARSSGHWPGRRGSAAIRRNGRCASLLPDLGRAIRRTAESRTGAPAVHAAMRDERYARYLEEPEALREPGAVADGERVLLEILDDGQREELVRDAAAAIDADEEPRAGSCRWSRPWPWPRSAASCASRRRRSPGSAPAPMTISMRRSWTRWPPCSGSTRMHRKGAAEPGPSRRARSDRRERPTAGARRTSGLAERLSLASASARTPVRAARASLARARIASSRAALAARARARSRHRSAAEPSPGGRKVAPPYQPMSRRKASLRRRVGRSRRARSSSA